MNVDKVLYLTKSTDKTPEGEVMDNLGLTDLCCRRHFLTHVDIEYSLINISWLKLKEMVKVEGITKSSL